MAGWYYTKEESVTSLSVCSVEDLSVTQAAPGSAGPPPTVVPQPLLHGSAVNQSKTFRESVSLKIQPPNRCSPAAPEQEVGAGRTLGISHGNAHKLQTSGPRVGTGRTPGVSHGNSHKLQMLGKGDGLIPPGVVSPSVEMVDMQAVPMGKDLVPSSVVPWPLPSDAQPTEENASSKGARMETKTPANKAEVTEGNQNPEGPSGQRPGTPGGRTAPIG